MVLRTVYTILLRFSVIIVSCDVLKGPAPVNVYTFDGAGFYKCSLYIDPCL